jgi:hypothetical protein
MKEPPTGSVGFAPEVHGGRVGRDEGTTDWVGGISAGGARGVGR